MGLPNGVHHLAIATKDIKKQIEFYTEVVGMELVALYWMHGVEKTFHGFLRMNDSSSIAFVQGPEMASIEGVPGVSHPPWTGSPVAQGVSLAAGHDYHVRHLGDQHAPAEVGQALHGRLAEPALIRA